MWFEQWKKWIITVLIAVMQLLTIELACQNQLLCQISMSVKTATHGMLDCSVSQINNIINVKMILKINALFCYQNYLNFLMKICPYLEKHEYMWWCAEFMKIIQASQLRCIYLKLTFKCKKQSTVNGFIIGLKIIHLLNLLMYNAHVF